MIVSVQDAINILRAGGVVALPTETVYGLAGNATNPQAVAQIFAVKNRPADNPLICHFADIASIEQYVETLSPLTRRLLERFSPGPISVMADLPVDSPLRFATCGSLQVIVRIPNHPLTLTVLHEVTFPLAAPSANTSGQLSPTTAQMVEADLGQKGIAVVDGGACRVGVESTIVDARAGDVVRILRPGAIGPAELLQVMPAVRCTIVSDGQTAVPGSRHRHYAPRTPVYLWKTPPGFVVPDSAVLLLEEQRKQLEPLLSRPGLHVRQLVLGSLANLEETARNFYQRLHQLDSLGVKQAFFLKTDWGSSSLGLALQDRMNKICQSPNETGIGNV